MNNHEKYFKQKFNECAKQLTVKSNDIISLKYRGVRNNQYYIDLLGKLKNINNLEIKDIGIAMGGRAYKISYGNQDIIVVEHETGLEILYIAGSVASLIGLVLQVSSLISNHRRAPYFDDEYRDVEIRYFDKKNKFHEDHKHNYLPYEIFLLPESNEIEIEKLKKRVDKLEKEIKKN